MVSPASLSLRNRVAEITERWPECWRAIQQVRYRNSNFLGKIVTPKHHIALEGFPRSGNSFALRAFLFANGNRQSWAIATHAHRYAQVELSTRWSVPTAIFIRDPREAVISLAALFLQGSRFDPGKEEKLVCFMTEMMRYYTLYHDTVHKISDRAVISDFSITTNHFQDVIVALNVKFGTDFLIPVDYVNMQKTIFETSGVHLSPSEERQALKLRLNDLMKNHVPRGLVDRAVASYKTCREIGLTY